MVSLTGYWTSESLQFMDVDAGDEIDFDGKRWCVEVWDNKFGSQRNFDTIMHCNVKLRDISDPLHTLQFKLYPGWYLLEMKADQRPPEFKYTLVEKDAWEQVWVRKENA